MVKANPLIFILSLAGERRKSGERVAAYRIPQIEAGSAGW
jgi:hypothetical protein